MGLWTFWLATLQSAVAWLASDVGLGTGLAVVALTLALRGALLPISWTNAYRACVRQKKLLRLQPELARLKEELRGDPHALAERTLALYREHDVAPFDSRALLGALVQMPILLGMYQTLRNGAAVGRFLWTANLARPDLWLSVLAGVTTALMIAANPDLPEHMRALMIIVPAIVAAMLTLKVASAIALYWAASNCFTAAQTVAVHYVVRRQVRTGALRA